MAAIALKMQQAADAGELPAARQLVEELEARFAGFVEAAGLQASCSALAVASE